MAGAVVTPQPEPTDIAAAFGEDRVTLLTVGLSGTQVIPAADTRQTGSSSFSLDNNTAQLFGSVNSSVQGVTAVHLHEGAVGEVGAEVLELIADDVGQYSVPAMTFLDAQDSASLRAGAMYVDVHTVDFPAGELRAQLSDDPVVLTVLPTLDDIQAKIFTPNCSGCHTGGGQTLPGILNLSNAAASYISLVGVSSISVPELLRVEPGAAESSFFIHKVEGTQSVGSRMPLRGSKLDDAILQSIRQWVDNGALR